MTRCFISGRITGMPNLNREAFTAAADYLRRKGHEPVNPHDICSHLPADSEHADYMEVCKLTLQTCGAIYMLDGWEQSRGAREEFAEAQRIGMPVWFEAIREFA